ncbi:tol-pal system-associated acyl-CoA thioesterase [Mangrovicoccus algicola]|uniref:Tol-pal system-associated acyl-CoA thioesterase n=1 Tax=Mangrovicoccus algicola TaxID=2771008 RepID=A0A8J6ZF81_9RHOB|nr:tol-pal system-associated acyl-CoA thioesterase [Mangrovicoccus algicola]MBE3640436.1 tol-pal system-associated acyl-CoA thioesterase [Mangrovicoccus algicola]
MTAPHVLSCRVHYEDTDMAGIVYHANYLKFIERARSDWVRRLGIDQNALRAAGQVFVLRRIEADFLAPARFDDQLEVVTQVQAATGARLVLMQEVRRDGTCLFRALATLALATLEGRPQRMPAALRALPGAD